MKAFPSGAKSTRHPGIQPFAGLGMFHQPSDGLNTSPRVLRKCAVTRKQ